VWGEQDWLDVERFEAALDSANCASQPQEKLSLLEEALNLYEGPLLPQWHDQAWLGSDRELLASRWCWALGQAVEVSCTLGQLEGAVRWQRALVSSAPAQSSQQARLIELLLQAGDVPAAAQQYKRCREVLASELGQQPDAALQALEARIKALQQGRAVTQPANGVPPGTAAQDHTAAITATTAVTAAPPPAASLELVGRTQDTEALMELLLVGAADSRIIVMTGLGGVGKTTLARSVMAKWAQHTGQTARFVQVSEITAAELLADVLRQALGLPASLLDESAASADPSRYGHINGLLVIDNFEHLEQCAALVSTLVQRCPQLTVLITSRIALPLAQAAHYPLAPLEAGTAGVALFVKHARKRNASLSFNYQEIDEIARICTLLDGLPLAIELAAARVRLYSPAQLLQRLLRDLQLLHDNPVIKAGEAHSARGGARSLWEVLQWSYQQLQPDQQELLTWLSVFPGGATLEMLEQVLQAQPWSVPDVLEGLLDLQLVSVKHAASGLPQAEAALQPRYGLLETVRHFVLHSGLSSKAWLAQARQGQAQYFVQCMEQIGEQEMEAGQDKPMRLFKQEIHNISAAFEYLLETDPSSAARYISLSGATMWDIGFVDQAHSWVSRAAALSAIALTHADRERIELFQLHFTANFGQASDLDDLVRKLVDELEQTDNGALAAVRKVQQASFCLQYLRRTWGENARAVNLARRLWEASCALGPEQTTKRTIASEYSACLIAAGEFDLVDQFTRSLELANDLSADSLILVMHATWCSVIRGRERTADLQRFESMCPRSEESIGLLPWVYIRSTVGLIAIIEGDVLMAQQILRNVNEVLAGRSLPAGWEVVRKQLSILVDVHLGEPAIVCQAVFSAREALMALQRTSARAEWIGACIEIAVIARDYEAAREAIELYCETISAQNFSRCLRIAEALGGLGTLLDETEKAEEFYALANAARRLIGGKILPIHVNLRRSVGAPADAGENSSLFKGIELADLSGKRFWELTAPRALELLNRARTNAALQI
jgi:predicted ATPase